MKTVLLTLLALIAFAGNSVLSRLALAEQAIDATGFTAIRLVSGAVVLLLILLISQRQKQQRLASKLNAGSWLAAVWLFIYAITFSFAYLSLETGLGALILFTTVQITMIGFSLYQGNKLSPLEWCGTALALIGFGYLMLPSISGEYSMTGIILMLISGIAWAFYTLAGKQSSNPLADTTSNFIRTIPMVALLIIISYSDVTLSDYGIWLAFLSGALASGVGYTIWYMALKNLTSTQAAVVQLTVPAIAAFGGIVFSNESVSKPLIIASFIILCGILMVIHAKTSPASRSV